MFPKKFGFLVSLISFMLLSIIPGGCNRTIAEDQTGFQSERAFTDLRTQVEMGPRIPGSQSHSQFRDWLIKTLQDMSWEIQENNNFSVNPPTQNIIAHYNADATHWIFIGAHYDSRAYADQSQDNEDKILPVPGANDGASGVSVLTELARSLPKTLSCKISLAFFDSEDQGEIDGHNWSEGASFFAESLTTFPDEVVIIDMVGDSDLEIFRERNSTSTLTDTIWAQAASLGYAQYFQDKPKYAMTDDHLPFLSLGIDTSLLIDFDYPAWHTPNDNLDQVSEKSLEIVGNTLYAWLTNHPLCQPTSQEIK